MSEHEVELSAKSDALRCWRGECFPACYYPDVCSVHKCQHDWMLRPESDTYECLICGDDR